MLRWFFFGWFFFNTLKIYRYENHFYTISNNFFWFVIETMCGRWQISNHTETIKLNAVDGGFRFPNSHSQDSHASVFQISGSRTKYFLCFFFCFFILAIVCLFVQTFSFLSLFLSIFFKFASSTWKNEQ